MKRYTGQQALYEAISRSRAKAKQGSILERLRPESEKPKVQESSSSAEPEQMAEPAPVPTEQEPNEAQAGETPVQPEAEQESPTQPVAETSPEPVSEVTAEPAERSAPVVKPRPVERLLHPAASKPVQTWLRPRPVQFNEGRIEVSVPYYVGAIVGLAVMVVVLAAFRLGQARPGDRASDAGPPVQPVANRAAVPANRPVRPTAPEATADTARPQPNPTVPDTMQSNVAPATPQGDHWIVLAQYQREQDFEPVKRHFAEHGISLGIVSLARAREVFAANAAKGLSVGKLPSGEGFLLVTMDFFDNPTTSGTDGDKMIKRIIEVGALYKGKAPSGYESFAPNYFRDAYPMKIR